MRLCNNNAPECNREICGFDANDSPSTTPSIHSRTDHDGGRGDICDHPALGRRPSARKRALEKNVLPHDPVKDSYVAVQLNCSRCKLNQRCTQME